MEVGRELEVDVACAVEGLAWVEGVYRLDPSEVSFATQDAYSLAIVLAPYDIDHLVRTHYAVLVATGDQEATGKVLYVQGGPFHSATPMRRAKRIVPALDAKRSARERIAARKAAAAQREAAGSYVVRAEDLELAFRRLAEVEASTSSPPSGSETPYRGGTAIVAPLTSGGVYEIVPDPFPAPPRKCVLLVDDDPASAQALAALARVDVVHAEDGWSAIDALATRTFDLVICSAVLGEFPGAKIYRIAVKERPELASRFVFLAGLAAVASAPPESARGRVLARPLDAAAVTALLARS